MTESKSTLLRPLTAREKWVMVPFKDEKGSDKLAILNPNSRFMLHPMVTGPAGVVFYQPKAGWLEVSVSAFSWDERSISFRVHKNTLPGVGLKEMTVASGTIEIVESDLLLLEVHGLTFDGKSPVEWISFEEFATPFPIDLEWSAAGQEQV